MCAKLYTGRDGKKKYDWTEMSVKLKWEGASSSSSPYSDSLYIDTFQMLSMINHKLIPQGQLARIKNFRIFSQHVAEQLRFKVGVIPRTWMTRNAWVKSKAMFDEMNALAAANVGGESVYPKWHDYKVYMNNAHRLQSGTDVLYPSDMDDDVLNYGTVGEWKYAEFSDSGATSDNYFVHMLGDHVVTGSDDNFQSVGIIQAYKESRAKQPASSPTLETNMDKSPWGRLFGDDDQTNDVFDDLESNNDQPPYQDAFIGGSEFTGGLQVGVGTLSNTNNDKGTQAVRLPNFVAPCGLIRLELDDVNNFDTTATGIEIHFDVEILGKMDM